LVLEGGRGLGTGLRGGRGGIGRRRRRSAGPTRGQPEEDGARVRGALRKFHGPDSYHEAYGREPQMRGDRGPGPRPGPGVALGDGPRRRPTRQRALMIGRMRFTWLLVLCVGCAAPRFAPQAIPPAPA